MDYVLVSVAQSKLLIYLSLLRTPKLVSQYPATFQQRYRLLSSFSRLDAAEEFGCPCAVLSANQFSLGEGVIQAGTWLCWVSVAWVGSEKRQYGLLLIMSLLPFSLLVLPLKVIFCGIVQANRFLLKPILHTMQPYLTREEHMALSYYLLFQGN